MKLFKKKCEHVWKPTHISNISQPDQDGYPTRLCICKCEKCGETSQKWVDCPIMVKNLPSFEKVVEIEWKEIVRGKSRVTIDTPARCTDCRLYQTYGLNGDQWCRITNKKLPFNGSMRPDWCPLEEVEEKEDDAE